MRDAGWVKLRIPHPPSRIPALRYRVLLRHVPARRLGHHAELVEPHHRVVAHLQLEPRLLLQLPQEVRLLFHEIQRDFGVEPYSELALLVLRAGALERALHPAHHHFGPKYASGAIARRALGGHRRSEERSVGKEW